MMNFGSFANSSDDGSWGIWELPLFIGVGILGGLFGASFNAVNCAVTKWRLSWINGRQPAVGGPGSARDAMHSGGSSGVAPASAEEGAGTATVSPDASQQQQYQQQQGGYSHSSSASSSSGGGGGGGGDGSHYQRMGDAPSPPPKQLLQQQQQQSLGASRSAPSSPSPSSLPCWRRPSALRVWEVLAIVCVVSTTAFFAPLFFGTCSPRPSGSGSGGGYHSAVLVSFYCRSDEFNDIASFWFAPQEEAIRLFYHFTAEAASNTTTAAVAATAATSPSGTAAQLLLLRDVKGSALTTALLHRDQRGRQRSAEEEGEEGEGGLESGGWDGGSNYDDRGARHTTEQSRHPSPPPVVTALTDSVAVSSGPSFLRAASGAVRALMGLRGRASASRSGSKLSPEAGYGGDVSRAPLRASGGTPPFTSMHLGMFFLLYTASMCFTSGTAIPSGESVCPPRLVTADDVGD